MANTLETNNEFVCSLCAKKCTGWGNNPWPLDRTELDRCCDECNKELVIPARLRRMLGGNNNGEE